MKKLNHLILLSIGLFPSILFAQNNNENALKMIREQDSLFWKGYNNCDYNLQGKLIADDIEFYHDKGGITQGKAAMLESVKSLCGPDFRLRRAAIDSTVRIHLMKAKDTVYGAIISGTHQFYLTPTGKPERLDGQALFANLWLYKSGDWKLSRVFSYDHGPAKYINKRKQVKLSKAVLGKYAGDYIGKQTGKLTVSVEGDHLALLVGDKPYHVYPETGQLFFSKDRDLTFEFQQASDKTKKLVIREFGGLVEEAEFTAR